MKRVFVALILCFVLLLSGCVRSKEFYSIYESTIEITIESKDESSPAQSEPAESSKIKSSKPSNPSERQVPAQPVVPKTIELDEQQDIDTIWVDEEEFSSDTQQYLYAYNALSDRQKKAYRMLLTVANEMPAGLIDFGPWEGDYQSGFYVCYDALRNDWPELFWMPSTYVISVVRKGYARHVVVGFEYSQKGIQNSYLATRQERDEMVSRLQTRVEEIVSLAPLSEGPLKTEKYFHDVLCKDIEYVSEGTHIRNTYGALIEGRAVCEGYARAFQLLCRSVGIDCDLICGNVEGTPHMWNVVRFQSGWCHVDVTWDDDDKNDFISYLYYNVTDEQIQKTHTVYPHFGELTSAQIINAQQGYNLNLRSCTFGEYSYFLLWNHIIGKAYGEYASIVSNAIKQRNAEGQKYAQFIFASDEDYKEFMKKDKDYIASIQRQLGRGSFKLQKYSLFGESIVFFW